MAALKTKASYANVTDKGKPIRIRFTATNILGETSLASEANVDTAIYQEAPEVYDGANKITKGSVGVTTATISWTAVTSPADGYSTITGYAYWFVPSPSGTTISGTTTDLTKEVTGLTASTTYTAYVEPLNVYQPSLTNPRSGTTGLTVITSSVPAAPTDVNVSLNVANAKIQWTAPVNPQNPVTSYSV